MATFISFGHSTKTFEDFIRLIERAGITTVADVRRFPQSRRHPHFSRNRLERELPSKQITYIWLGDELGGFRDEGYEAWMRTEIFKKGIDALQQLPQAGFMCSEGAPWKCHRRFVSRALSQRGHHVLHLLPDGSLQPEDPQLALPDL